MAPARRHTISTKTRRVEPRSGTFVFGSQIISPLFRFRGSRTRCTTHTTHFAQGVRETDSSRNLPLSSWVLVLRQHRRRRNCPRSRRCKQNLRRVRNDLTKAPSLLHLQRAKRAQRVCPANHLSEYVRASTSSEICLVNNNAWQFAVPVLPHFLWAREETVMMSLLWRCCERCHHAFTGNC